MGSFSPSQLLLRDANPIVIPFPYLFILFYPVMSRVSCPFWMFKFFCQHSVDVLCVILHVDVFFWCVCGRRWVRPLTPLSSCSTSEVYLFWLYQILSSPYVFFPIFLQYPLIHQLFQYLDHSLFLYHYSYHDYW